MSSNVVGLETVTRPGRGWNMALWIAQVPLALAFGMAGAMKSTAPMAELVNKMVWPGALPEVLVRFIGIAEFAGALGVILPAALRIYPKLTPLAAAGLATIQVLAVPFHLVRGEYMAMPINLSLAALAAFVAWGRYRKAPIASRPDSNISSLGSQSRGARSA